MTSLNRSILAYREASKVRRYHNLEHHGEQTVGQHSFDMITLAYWLVPSLLLTRNMLLAIAFHDLPERWIGDVPAPAKDAMPQLKNHLDVLEETVSANFCMDGLKLNSKQKVWLKALDRLEAFLWGHDQLALGNKNAQDVVDYLTRWFAESDCPETVKEFVEDFEWERTPDRIL